MLLECQVNFTSTSDTFLSFLALINATCAQAPIFTFYKFKSVNVSSALLSDTGTFHLQDLRATVSMFGKYGVFEKPTESMLRSYPEALLRLYNVSTDEFNIKYVSLLRGLSKKPEHETEYVVLKDLISPLCGKCLVSKHGKPKSYLEQCLKTESLQVTNLGVGNTATWHGYLDALAVPNDSPTVPIIVSESLSEESEVEDEDEEDQKSLREEPKSQGYLQKVNQAVAESIVFSTIQHNRHKDQPCFVPTILLDGWSAIVVLYDCVFDVLLVSRKVEICRLGLSDPGLALLWIVLHHQAFLKDRKEFKDVLKDTSGQFCSGFQEACRRDGTESLYKGLLEYDQKGFTTPEFPPISTRHFFADVGRKRKLDDM